MGPVNDGIAILLGGEVAGTANDYVVDVHKSLRRGDLEDQVAGIGPDHLRWNKARHRHAIDTVAVCSGLAGVVRQGIEDRSGIRVETYKEIGPEKEEGAGRQKKCLPWT